MGRILAIDYGRKRTGLAVTDILKIIANGLETVPTHKLEDFLTGYFAKEDVEKVVIGYPKQLNNQPSEAVIYVDAFLKRFKKLFPDKEYVLVDERFTSKMAFQAMIDGGVKKQDRKNKALIDKVSATIILQEYLNLYHNSL
jgi:putative holliday junction resolvase